MYPYKREGERNLIYRDNVNTEKDWRDVAISQRCKGMLAASRS